MIITVMTVTTSVDMDHSKGEVTKISTRSRHFCTPQPHFRSRDPPWPWSLRMVQLYSVNHLPAYYFEIFYLSIFVILPKREYRIGWLFILESTVIVKRDIFSLRGLAKARIRNRMTSHPIIHNATLWNKRNVWLETEPVASKPISALC